MKKSRACNFELLFFYWLLHSANKIMNTYDKSKKLSLINCYGLIQLFCTVNGINSLQINKSKCSTNTVFFNCTSVALIQWIIKTFCVFMTKTLLMYQIRLFTETGRDFSEYQTCITLYTVQ